MKKYIAFIISIAIMMQGILLPVRASNVASIKGWSVPDPGAVVDTEIKASGNASLKIVKDGDVEGYYSWTTPFRAQKDKKYVYGFKAKAKQATKQEVMIDWGKRTSLTPLGNTYDWTEFKIEYEHTTPDANVVIRFTMDGTALGFWIDDVYCYELKNGSKTGENLIENGDFEILPDYLTLNNETVSKVEILPISNYFDTLNKQEYIPVYYKNSDIIIDGNTAEWNDYVSLEATQINSYFSGKPDATLHLKYTYDDEKFYLLGISKDDIWAPGSGDQYWGNDCMQMGFSKFGETFGKEIGISYDTTTNKPYITAKEGMEAAVSRNGDTIIYEMSFTWNSLYGEKPEEFLFCALAGDNDGAGRNYVVELCSGISASKNNEKFPCMVLLEDKDAAFAYITGEKITNTFAAANYTLHVVNNGSKQNVTLSSDILGFEKNIELQEKSTYAEIIPYVHDDFYGDLKIDLESIDDIKTYSKTVLVNPTEEVFADKLIELDERIIEIENLIKECEKASIPTDYETVHLSTMKMFSQNIIEDIKTANTQHVSYNFEALDEVYSEAKSNLKNYLNGADVPKYVPRYQNGTPIEIRGNSIWGNTVTNGIEEFRPIFLVGYGHFERVGSEAHKFPGFGTNYIAQEFGPRTGLQLTSNTPYWIGIGKGQNGKMETNIQSDEVHSGENAVYITNETALTPNVYQSFYQALLVEPNTTYKFGGWVKSKEASGVKISLNDYRNSSMLPSETKGWEPFEFEFTTDSTSYYTVLRIISEDICEGLYLDDLYVYKVGTNENLIYNGDFETKREDMGDMMPNFSSSLASLCQRLDNAQKSNVAVSLLISPHYFPNDIYTQYPETAAKTPGTIHFRVDNEKVREILELHIKTLLTSVARFDCITDICLSNEPCYSASANEFYKPLWVEYLKEIYNNDISLLNKYYESNYTSFDEIEMPNAFEETVRNYDYVQFNNKIFTEWHQWLAEQVKKIMPEKPVHVKLMFNMQAMHTDKSRRYYNYGYNWEEFAQFTDFIGLDGGSTYKPGSFLVNDFIKTSHLGFYFSTDFITSIADKPWINSEDHIVEDNSDDFSMDQADHIGRHIWQGGIHGRAGSAIWVWDRISRDASFKGSIIYRPDAIVEVGRSTLDLNRLSKEVVAVSNADRNVGILYSYSARNYNSYLDNNMFSIYSGITYNGLKTKFISENNITALNEDIKILFVPNAVQVKEEIIEAIIRYQQNGGKVVIFGEDSLTRNVKNQPHDSELIKEIYSKSDIIPIKGEGYALVEPNMDEMQNIINKYIDTNKLNVVKVVDAETDERVKDIEWEYNIYNGKLLLNICSFHDYHDKIELSVLVGNKKIGKMKDLRSGIVYNERITIDPSYPVLLQISVEHPFLDVYGSWSEDNIKNLYLNNIVEGKTETSFDPNGTLTYAEWITLLIKKLGISTQEITGGHWSSRYINAAKREGILFEDIEPDKAISRGEMCKILVKAIESTGKVLEYGELSFLDKNVCDYDSVSKAVGLGIISGYEDNTFRPTSLLSRAEAAKIINLI